MEQKVRIAQLKERKRLLEETRDQLVKSLTTPQEDSGSSEEQTKELKDKIAKTQAEIIAINAEMLERRMNKLNSSFFEWHPNKGMNRQQARRFRKLRREGRLG